MYICDKDYDQTVHLIIKATGVVTQGALRTEYEIIQKIGYL